MFTIHDHNRQVNVCGYNPKAKSKPAHIVDANVQHNELKVGQVFLLLINKVVELKGLNHHLL